MPWNERDEVESYELLENGEVALYFHTPPGMMDRSSGIRGTMPKPKGVFNKQSLEQRIRNAEQIGLDPLVSKEALGALQTSLNKGLS